MSLNELDLEGVEAQQEFATIKPGIYRTRVAEIEELTDDQGRNIIKIQHEYVNPESIEVIGTGKPGRLFNTIYLHKKEALGFLRAFVEAHGISWDYFRQSRDVSQFVGLEAETNVKLDTYEGVTRNKVARYIVAKS